MRVGFQLLTSAALLVSSCTLPEPADLEVELQFLPRIPIVVSPSHPLDFTATATNHSPSSIQWGQGSSSCQLDLTVTVGSRELPAAVARGCTDDYAPQGLSAAGSRSEQLPWAGEVIEGGLVSTLPPGEYELRARAGMLGRSRPLRVIVEE